MIKLIGILLCVLVAAQASDFDDQFIADESDFLDNSIADDDDVAFDFMAEDELEHSSDWADESNSDLIEIAQDENGIGEEDSFVDGEFETFDSEANVEESESVQGDDDDDDEDSEDGTNDDQEVEVRTEGRSSRKPGQLGMNENRRRRGRRYYKPRKSSRRGGSRRSRYSTMQPVQPSDAPTEDEDSTVGSNDVGSVDRSRFERRQRPRSRSRSRSRSRPDSYPPRSDRPDRPCFGEGCTAPPRKSNCTGRPSGRPTGKPHHRKWSTPEIRRSSRSERVTDLPQGGTSETDGTPASWWSWWSF